VENSTNVLILCCNRLLRESISRILSKKTDFNVIAPDASDPAPSLKAMGTRADVVVLDSLQVLAETSILESGHGHDRIKKCALVAMADDQKSFLSAIRLGALGYVLQDASALEVINAIRSVSQGEAVCPSRYVRTLYDYFLARTTLTPNSKARLRLGLTRREQQLIPLIERGMTNKEIATNLNLSEQTVKNHVHRILRKVGVDNRLGVVEAVQDQTLGL
jgi:two-component system response regulator DevR